MKTVPLGGKKAAGRVVLVDDEDYDLVMQYRWFIYEPPPGPGRCGPYAVANTRIDGRKTVIRMHKLLTGWPLTDHKNHDGLDNRRSNLRSATGSQNNQNRRGNQEGTSQYKGVCWRSAERKWRAAVKLDRRTRFLGFFVSELEAAYAYDAAARTLFGEFACTNFPEGPTRDMREQWAAERERSALAASANGARLRAVTTAEHWKQHQPETRACTWCGSRYESRATYSFYCGYRCRRTAAVERAKEKRQQQKGVAALPGC